MVDCIATIFLLGFYCGTDDILGAVMLIGCLIIILAIFFVLIGTNETEAQIFYYDLEVSKDSRGNDEDSSSARGKKARKCSTAEGVEDSQDVLSSQPGILGGTTRSKVRVTVDGSTLGEERSSGQGQRPRSVDESADPLDEVRRAAAENDPNKKAQNLFDSIKGGM